MNLVTLESITKEYGERVLLDEVDLLINEGDRIGLIGVNGSGKTSMLRIIAGIDQPDSGSVTVWGGVRIEYLPQDPHLPGDQTVIESVFTGDSPQLQLLSAYQKATSELQKDPANIHWQNRMVELVNEMDRSDGWTAEANTKAILTKLGISDFYAPVSTLSGGQGKRVALARALIDQADLLILDEPTNHIDADAIDWLEAQLTKRPSALLMVTHDRYFLGRVVNRIVELDRRQLVNYRGNYRRYLELRTTRHERLAAAEKKRQNLLRRELEWLRRGAMARSTKQKARKQRIEELQIIRTDRGDESVAMALTGRRLGKKVLESQNLAKSFADISLFQNVDFSLVRGDRIGLIGPNGVGKSTLLDILSGDREPDEGTVTWGASVHLAYYDQLSRGLDESMRVIDYIEEKAPLIRTKEGRRVDAAKMLQWFLFPRPQQRTMISSLSGGEKRRLYLLWVLVHQPNVLFLDEPTNDLDLPTLAVLEEFLDRFKGSLVVVSHDRYFLDRNVDFLATFENGSLSSRYPAPYSNYKRIRQEIRDGEFHPLGGVQVEPLTGAGVSQKTKNPAEKGPRSRTLTWKEARELESLEKTIAGLEKEKVAVEKAINEAGGDYKSLHSLSEQLRKLETELERNVERWMELSEASN
jgi:ATP-binding cassette subfamily F protein uup